MLLGGEGVGDDDDIACPAAGAIGTGYRESCGTGREDLKGEQLFAS